jgi:hypothetical protein
VGRRARGAPSCGRQEAFNKYGQSKEFVGHLLQLANARRSQKQLKTVCRALRIGRSGLGEVLKFNEHRITFVLFDKKFSILD